MINESHPPTDSNWETQVQKDLDDGKFIKICSNETTFKEYVTHLIQSEREKLIEAISEDITNYDEVYISEDVRKAINRMKYSLKTFIKNKEE